MKLDWWAQQCIVFVSMLLTTGPIWKLYKFTIRRVTGKCEIVRISESKQPTYLISAQLSRSFHNSTQLRPLFPLVKNPDMDVDDIVSSILKIKQIPVTNKQVVSCLSSWLASEKGILILVKELSSLAKESYSRDNTSHENQLEILWNILRPGVHRVSRDSDAWQDIGFQGKDPATDFRAMGMLGLTNMLTFARQYPNEARAIMETTPYPFAITTINLTSHLLNLCRQGKLSMYFYKHGHDMEQFQELFAQVNIKFSKFYINENPPDIMGFPMVMKKFLIVLPQHVNEGKEI